MNKYALIAAIESDKKNLNNQKNIIKIDRMYEQESISCFTSWRKNADWLKDIPIYVLCPTKNTIKEETKKCFEKLNVVYIEEYHNIVEKFTSGFLNIPFVGKLFEERLTEDVLIKIDLDMNLIKPLPQSLVDSKQVICGQYDDYCTKQQRQLKENWTNPFDTGFMISNRKSGIYALWFNMVMNILEDEEKDKEWLSVKSQTGDYYLEEYVIDKIFNEKLSDIKPIQKYQIGEWYTPVSEFTDDELKNVYFWHEHLISDPKYDKIRQKVEYFNRMKNIK